jgi:putative tryptophan/tyrosine transport system substrate-binding protein
MLMLSMRRREFITLLGGAAVTWPLTVRAQQRAAPVIGFLAPASPAGFASQVRALRQGLTEIGYVEGRNLAVEFRWAEDQNDRLPALAAELVRRPVSVIVAAGFPAIRAAKTATSAIPIVFNTGEDPVKLGLVESLSRPGGNVTGITSLGGQLGAKRLELLHELVPTTSVVAALVNPTNPVVADAQTKEWQAAASTLGLRLHVVHASTERDFDAVFARLRELRAGGLVIGPDALTISRSGQLAALALRHAVPAIFQFGAFTAAGGLMSYGASTTDAFHLVGTYAGRVLKGEQPADLPVQQATKVELVINLKTAKALGIEVPPTLLARADEVIE